MDFIVTLCDDAAGEDVPVWPGHPMSAHWGIEDPVKVAGGDLERERAMALTFRHLKNRIGTFINLPIRSLDKIPLQTKLNQIGRLEGPNEPTPL